MARLEVDQERYQDLGPLGRGGMAEVRRVRDRRMGRTVAMKRMLGTLLGDPGARQRFLHEARITASLQHPGIPAVHDVGDPADGLPWFTMKQVHGRTFGAIIAELHRPTSPVEELTLGRVIDALLKACDAVAYAHSRGVIHRDIKPANLMAGRFGEVYVMDWGLAIQRDEVAAMPNSWREDAILAGPPALDARHVESLPTRIDEDEAGLVGTLAYMSPEQALGDGGAITERSDVYALGAVLYELMAGRPAFAGTPGEVWTAIVTTGPRPLGGLGPSPHRPDELCAICQRAMQLDPGDRFEDAGALATALRAWLDGTRRRDKATGLVGDADRMWLEIEESRQRAASLAREAERLLEGIEPHHDVERKAPVWELQDEAAQIERKAAVLEVTWQQTLRSALNEVPDFEPAHERLADYYRSRHEALERARDHEGASGVEVLLRAHDRGLHATYLQGEVSLDLVTSPPGAEIALSRFEPWRRRLVAQPTGLVLTSPARDVRLPVGSYLAVITKPGFETVRYPILLRRGERWTGVRPGATEPLAIELPPMGSLDADDVYVPAGPFQCGGDPSAIDGLPAGTCWIDAFVTRRFPVTNREYGEFLTDLARTGGLDAALRHAPKPPKGREQGEVGLWCRDSDGRFIIGATVEDGERLARRPINLVDWHDARAYAAWLAARDGLPWRLPSELEWEKAARGVDGRFLPWGDVFDHAHACVVHSQVGRPDAVDVEAFDLDESPYGVRGLAGNVRDWCLDRWDRSGPAIVDGILTIAEAPDSDDGFRAVRGGAWTAVAEHVRMASRFGALPRDRFRGQGFRLARG
ncbi:MAG: SUMF1/EgtB/PvdO family nonheme iron enzyme [Polyangiaceae bacterium]